jgi:ssDNA-specific exonuclease RecJ
MDEKINQLLEKFGNFYNLFCEMKEEDIRKEYERLCDKIDLEEGENEEDEDKMNRMFVMMECMGMMN